MKAVSSERLLTVEQTAEKLGVKTTTIRAWILQRRITVIKVGRCVRVPLEAVEDIIARGRRPAIPEGDGRR